MDREQVAKAIEALPIEWYKTGGDGPAEHAQKVMRDKAARLVREYEQPPNADRLAKIVEVCREIMTVVDECYTATGHIRVAKTSTQRMKIESMLAAIDAAKEKQ